MTSPPPGDLFVFTRGEDDSQRSYSYPQHEAKALAAQLGMDLNSDADLLWFLKEALVTILPQGWKKEANASGMAQYHNLKTGVTTETHPLLYIFRAAYHHLLETNEQQKAEASPIDDPSLLQSSTEQSRFFADLLKKVEKKQDSIKSTLRFEQAMHDAELFYSSLLTGSSVPKHLEDSLEYQSVAPERMMELARALGVQDDYRLLWVARVFAVLPLPPLWKRSHDPYRNDLYLNSHYNVTLGFHPSKNFLYKYIQTLRFGNLQASSPTMTFLDRHYRSYDIDLHRLMAGEDYVLRVRDFPGQRNLPATLFRPKIAYSQETIDGLMALDMADGDIEMLGLVYRYYAKMKEKMKGWEFRYTLQGERYWYQSGSQAAKRQYPFNEKLKRLLQQARSMHTRMLTAVLKSPEEVHSTLSSKDILDKMRKAAAELMGRHLSNYMESHNREALEAHDAAKWLSFKPYSATELMEILYACPFRLSALTLDTTSSLQFTSTETEEDGVLSPKDHYTIEVEAQNLLPNLESGAPVRSLKSLLARPRAARQSKVLEKELLERLTGRQGSGMRVVRKEEMGETVAGKALEEVRSLRQEQAGTAEESKKRLPEPQEGTQEQYRQETKAEDKQKRDSVEGTVQLPTNPSDAKADVKYADKPGETEVTSSIVSIKSKKFKHAFSKSLSLKGAFRQPASPGTPATSFFPSAPLSFDPSSLAKAAISGMMSRVGKSKSFKRNESRQRSQKTQPEEEENREMAEPSDIVKETDDDEKDSESGSNSPAASGLINCKSLLTTFLRNKLSFLSQPSLPSAQHEPVSAELKTLKGKGKTGSRLFSLDGRVLPSSPQFSSPAGSTVASPAHSRQTSTVLSSKSTLSSPKVSPSSSSSRRVFTLSTSQRALEALKRRRLGSAGEGSPRMRGGSFVEQLDEGKERGARKWAASRPMDTRTVAKFRHKEGPIVLSSPISPQLSSSFIAYYFQICGNPFDLFDLRIYRPYPGLSVPDIVSIGLRMGIKVSLEVLESLESDLLWVAYLQILVPEPPEWEHKGMERMKRLALGQHPGDEYFSLMLEYHRDRRNKLLKAMSRTDRVNSLLENSWLEVQPRPGVFSLHNFLTHEDGPSSALALVKFSFQPSRAAATAPGRVRRR